MRSTHPGEAKKLKTVARAIYTPAPTATELKYWGITAEQNEQWTTVELWPDNKAAVDVFIAMSTQWRNAGFGASGLDYNALPIVAPREFSSPDWPDIMESIRVLEDAALFIMNQQRERASNVNTKRGRHG